MEITKTFAPTFASVLFAKYRGFRRSSVWFYTVAVALITYGLHGHDNTLNSVDLGLRWMLYFACVCFVVVGLLLISAAIISHRLAPFTVVFKETDLTVTCNGKTIADSWDWIISAEDEPKLMAFVIRRFPRFELFINKDNLDETQYRLLRQWFIAHDKPR